VSPFFLRDRNFQYIFFHLVGFCCCCCCCCHGLSTDFLSNILSFLFTSIVMARHALFPETMIEPNNETLNSESDSNDDMLDDTEDDLETLLATLEGWNSPDDTSEQQTETKKSIYSSSSSSLEEKLTKELQVWRSKHEERNYDGWTSDEKQEFMVS
jgi:hypothetical protein